MVPPEIVVLRMMICLGIRWLCFSVQPSLELGPNNLCCHIPAMREMSHLGQVDQVLINCWELCLGR